MEGDDERDKAALVDLQTPLSAHRQLQDIKVYQKNRIVLGSLDEGDTDCGDAHREVHSAQVVSASKDNLDRLGIYRAVPRETSISGTVRPIGDRYEDNGAAEGHRQPAVVPDKPDDKRNRIAVVRHRELSTASAPNILEAVVLGGKDHRCIPCQDASQRRCIRVLDSLGALYCITSFVLVMLIVESMRMVLVKLNKEVNNDRLKRRAAQVQLFTEAFCCFTPCTLSGSVVLLRDSMLFFTYGERRTLRTSELTVFEEARPK
jgi:hypothetical protein